MVLDNKDDFDAGYRIYAKIMFWLSAKKARVIMTPSEFSKKSIENHWPKRNVIVNYWPIKQSSVNQNRLVNGNFIILWNAAMEKHKQPQLMLDIAIEVRKKLGIKLQLYVVTRRGNAWSNFMEELEKIPKWSEWITIYSNLSTEELSSLYELSDVLLVTSKAEGFCLPALEAMAKSLPVVHNNIETLVEVCGYRLDDHDFGILDSMVQQCVALSRNSEKLEDVRMQARHRSLNFSEERFDRQMQWILEES
jgi:glycosyltransferase involved in cell wall biosynthesis